MSYGLLSLPAPSVGLDLPNKWHPIAQVLYGSPFENVGLRRNHERQV